MKEIGEIREGLTHPSNATIPMFTPNLSALVTHPSPLIRLRGLLQAERQFAAALPEAERLRDLNRRFAGVVPKSVARACLVAALRGETAILVCAKGAAASRVRAPATGVARALSRNDAPGLDIKVKVRADWAMPAPPEKHDLPEAALDAFRDLGRHLPEGDLKAAVERLLSRRRGGG